MTLELNLSHVDHGKLPLRASAPPELDLLHTSPSNASPTQHSSSSSSSSSLTSPPPAYNPSLTVNFQNSTSGMTPLIEDAELKPKGNIFVANQEIASFLSS